MIARSRRRRRSGLPPAHRSRKTLVAALVGVVVVCIAIGEVAADVVNSGAPSALTEERSYVAAVVPVIDESSSLVSWLAEVRDRPASLGREGLLDALAHLVSGSADVEQQLASLGIPAPSVRSNELLSSVFADRAQAARTLTGAVSAALSQHGAGAGTALSRMESASSEIARSDREYRAFVRSIPPDARKGTVPLPVSSWDTSAAWTPSALRRYVTRLSSDAGLALRHDLSILAVTVQPPVLRVTPTTTTTTSTTTTTTTTTSSTTTTTTTFPGESTTTTVPRRTTTTTTTTSTSTTTTTLQVPPPNSTSWLAPTNRLTAIVVIANGGNVADEGVVLSATLTPLPSKRPPRSGHGRTSGSKKSVSKAVTLPPPGLVSHRVGTLAAGASLEVTLPAFRVRSGVVYLLKVTLAAPGGGRGQSDSESVRIDIV
jgi:hypothetical protein